MAEKIVSAGVFTREKDQSYLPVGISAIGAAIIGPTAKGPAFVPTLVESYSDYQKIFGDSDGNSYTSYTVKNYLANAGRATIVRTVNVTGYDSNVLEINLQLDSASVSTTTTAIVLAPTNATTSVDLSSWAVRSSSAGLVDFVLSGSGGAWSSSLDPTAANYIGNIFDTNPVSTKPFYIYATFPTFHSSSQVLVEKNVSPWSASFTSNAISNGIDLYSSSSQAYTEAETPWVQSQNISGKNYNLFKLKLFNCGIPDVKISIQDIKFSGEVAGTNYASFTVVVRSLTDDTDTRPNVIEQFVNVNMDPDSTDYIARAIGDQYRVFEVDSDGNPRVKINGEFPNQSKYIFVEINTDDIIPAVAAPVGFGAFVLPVKNVTAFPAPDYNLTRYGSGIWDSRKYLGLDFTNSDNNYIYQKPTIQTSVAGYKTASGFNLESITIQNPDDDSQVAWTTWVNASGSTRIKSADRRFSLAFIGGFDGFNPTRKRNMGTDITSATNVMGLDFTNSSTSGYISYKKAVDAVSNPDEFDINMLVLPGVVQELAGNIVSYAQSMCEDRQDTFFLFDLCRITDTVSQAAALVASTDSNYSATYYPWVKIYDDVNAKYIWAPPSVVMAGVIAFNDRVAAEWYAPAGLNRGGIDTAVQVYTRLTKADRDALYEARINPIATFVGQGIVAWGQKTLQAKSSALDRINVRRLLIALKKYIASTSKYLVFEQNTVATRTRFLNIVNPYLDSVQQRQGLYAFKVVMDETNNTPDIIDRNIMYGQIWLQPSRTAEMIIIDFNIMPTGASFSA